MCLGFCFFSLFCVISILLLLNFLGLRTILDSPLNSKLEIELDWIDKVLFFDNSACSSTHGFVLFCEFCDGFVML
jgi:hypothetical protein